LNDGSKDLTFFADAGLGLKSDWEVSPIKGRKNIINFFFFDF